MMEGEADQSRKGVETPNHETNQVAQHLAAGVEEAVLVAKSARSARAAMSSAACRTRKETLAENSSSAATDRAVPLLGG